MKRRVWVFLFCGILGGMTELALPKTAERAQETVPISPHTTATRTEPQPEELCAVCQQPVGTEGVAYEVAGQRIAIHRDELASDLAAQLRGLVRQLQPQGAFLGTREEYGGVSWIWFFTGLYILVGLGFAALCAHRAMHTGYPPVLCFFLGLFFTVFAYLGLLTRPRRTVFAPGGIPRGLGKFAATLPSRPCPGCGALNHPAAARCSGCGGKLEPHIESEAARVLSPLN
ncbi:MAG: hypothetical protein K6U02_12340 [Firmicutes bacterium]|nr:hypothetical protein [Bacillota bacterium]